MVWPQAHNDVLQKLLRKVRKGARMIYVPGNHDEFARDYIGMVFGGVEVADHAYHMTADKKRSSSSMATSSTSLYSTRAAAWLGDWPIHLLSVNLGFNKSAAGWVPYGRFLPGPTQGEERGELHRRFETALAEAARRIMPTGSVCGTFIMP